MPIAKELLIVRAGMFDLNDGGNVVQEKGVIEIFVPPGASMRNFRHDIAVLKMHTKFTFNDYVQPICIRPVPYDISKLVGVFGTVVGWGRTETSDISAKLRQAKVPVVSAYDCLDSDPYSFRLVATGKVYCAGSRNGTSSCNGDSGGGMYFRTGSHWYLRGITSFALEDENLLGKCDTYGYVGYTDVAMYLDWLRDRGVQLLHSKQDASSKKSVPRDRSKAHLRLAVDTGTKEFLQQHKGKLFLRVGLKGRKPESLFQ
ncbi:CLIP domain-containing serine protease B15-like [Anopheles stephensi]|uniref:CLIP domain-containing serine protease B15-like n=1 Tax=Anopheles stephensi TaxID=30069 RepID=UPI0016589E42|nr:CLIP domain-containing serine protease B15-like [Anopheles stephensi]